MTGKTKVDDNAKIDIIISAAQKRFGKYGLVKTTMNEIAADIGMGKASLYYYFPDKEALFEAVIKKELTEFMLEMNKMMDSGIQASMQLKKYVRIRNHFFKQLVNLSKLRAESFFHTKPIFGKVFENFYYTEIKLVKSLLKRGIDSKEFKKVNKQEYAELLIHLMQGLRLIRIKNKDIADLEENDYACLENETSKVISMFIKEIQQDRKAG